MTEQFAEALRASDVSAIERAPKSDLHSHSYLSAPIHAVERWLGLTLRRPPPKMDGLHRYLAEAVDPYLNSRKGFEFTALAGVQHAISDGVVLLEMSFDIRATAHYLDGLAGFSRFIQSLASQSREHIQLRPELGISKQTASNGRLTEVATEAISSGVFDSIDLYGDEAPFSPDGVKTLYERARSYGLILKAHIGEFGGAEDVRKTVEVLDLDEVQHGIGASESVDVMRWLSDNGIRLHICPTSNVTLDAVADLASHPIRTLYDHGVEVTVNTDDLLVFGQSVSDEYLNLFRSGVLTADELDGIREASLRIRDA